MTQYEYIAYFGIFLIILDYFGLFLIILTHFFAGM
jgi:hypothetical protein